MSERAAEKLGTEHIQRGQYPYCPHGARLGSVGVPLGGWNGPVGKCSCCFSVFVYIDQGGWSTQGPLPGRHWHPKDKCGSCGGSYHER